VLRLYVAQVVYRKLLVGIQDRLKACATREQVYSPIVLRENRSCMIPFASILLALLSVPLAGQQTSIDDQRLKISQKLKGHVEVSGSPDGVEGVLVEVCGSPWKMKGEVSCNKLLGSMRTNATGKFFFPSIRGKGIYYIRFFKTGGFNPLFVLVQLKDSGTPELTIDLPVAS